jgi:putative redox protein
MRATAHRVGRSFTHRIELGDHELIADEPASKGGDDRGPTPQELLAASLASCTAITLEMYAKRKGWNLGRVEVDCEYGDVERGRPTHFRIAMRVSSSCSEEQLEKLRVIAAKCPVHRTLAGEVTFEDRIELLAPADRS